MNFASYRLGKRGVRFQFLCILSALALASGHASIVRDQQGSAPTQGEQAIPYAGQTQASETVADADRTQGSQGMGDDTGNAADSAPDGAEDLGAQGRDEVRDEGDKNAPTKSIFHTHTEEELARAMERVLDKEPKILLNFFAKHGMEVMNIIQKGMMAKQKQEMEAQEKKAKEMITQKPEVLFLNKEDPSLLLKGVPSKKINEYGKIMIPIFMPGCGPCALMGKTLLQWIEENPEQDVAIQPLFYTGSPQQPDKAMTQVAKAWIAAMHMKKFKAFFAAYAELKDLSLPSLLEAAEKAGMAKKDFEAQMKDAKTQQILDSMTATLGKIGGLVNGFPTTIVLFDGGTRIQDVRIQSGAVPLNLFEKHLLSPQEEDDGREDADHAKPDQTLEQEKDASKTTGETPSKDAPDTNQAGASDKGEGLKEKSDGASQENRVAPSTAEVRAPEAQGAE
jgi:hypothetical protein